MKLKNILALPFAFVADVASCGNIGGDRSFTGQVLDKDTREQELDALVELVKALRGKEGL